MPALRNRGGHLQRFLRLVQQRKNPSQEIDPQDIYAVCDCGKESNKSKLLGAFYLAPEPDAAGKLQKPAPCKKQVRTWTAIMSESSITERLAKVRGFSSINQIQRIHLITRHGLQLNLHQRLHSNGTNRGNSLGPFTASSWEQDSDAWMMKMKEKLVLLGKHGPRIMVGGKEDEDEINIEGSDYEDDMEGSANNPRNKNDMEPFLYHAAPTPLLEELVAGLDPQAVICLAGDGRMAELCLERRIPYYGLAFTPEHVQSLTGRLEGRVFQKMQCDQSKLFSPQLKVILDKNCGNVQPEEHAEPKKKSSRKRKPSKTETDAARGDEEGGEPAGAAGAAGSSGQIDGNNGQDEKRPRKGKAKAKPDATGDNMLAELQRLAASAVE